ncbi:MAG: eutM 1 [Myxococcaceae bacterium]|nr:eutM 1 [Myxococcaceae bacterium]
MELPGPALGLIELESIARGMVVADALVKRAAVRISFAEAVTPGKYLLIFSGPVAEVEESFKAALLSGGPLVIDRLLLPQLSPGVARALSGKPDLLRPGEAVGIVETHTVASAILAADTAAKRANIRLTRLHLAKGIGGKGYFTIAGSQADVEAALEGAGASIEPSLLVTTEIIERPHPDLQGPVF